MAKLTVAELLDICSRAAELLYVTPGGHGLLVDELRDVATLCRDVIGSSHMGCASDEVILELGDG